MLSRLKSHVKINVLVLVCTVLLLVVTPQTVKADYQSPYDYTVTDGKATITDYYDPSAILVDPSTLGGYPVVAIADNAFGFSYYLNSVTLPNSLISIGDSAFYECSSLNIVNIPSSVTSIGYFAFSSCIELDAINVDPANLNYMSIEGVLFDKAGTTLIQYPAMKDKTSFEIPNTVTTIGDYAFGYCFFLTSISIPDGVTSIGDYAFTYTLMDSITIGSGVTSIGNRAFDNSFLLTSITIGNSVTSIGDYAFSGCSSLSSITFLGLTPPITATDWLALTDSGLLRGHAYYGSTFPAPENTFDGLVMGDYIPEDYDYTITDGQATIIDIHDDVGGDITIPDTLGGCPVVAIGDSAFYQCYSLTSITMPDSVTSIGGYAFYRCSSLTSVTIPDSVTSIGDCAFSYCSLTSITIPDSVTSIGRYAFESCTFLTSITMPDSVTSIGGYAFYRCYSLTSVTIPDTVTSISDHTFYSCSSLTSITIPKSVTSIGNEAFGYCSALTSVTIPRSVTNIGNEVFYHCTSLTELIVHPANPNYMSIDGVLFTKDGTKLIQYPLGKSDTSYTIPIRVTSIGDYAFYYCQSLTSITIPDSVTSIGDWAFSYCQSLTSITIPDSVTSIGDCAFKLCWALKSLVIPKSVTSIGNEAFWYCSGLTSVTIPDGVTSIGNMAFGYCGALTSVTIPKSVTTIGHHAFQYCISLTNINLLMLTPPSIGSYWIEYTPLDLQGHTYFGSSFTAKPGDVWWGRWMGDYIPDNEAPTIMSVTPSSSLITLYPQGSTASQTFSAAYIDNVAIDSATIFLDGDDVSSTWGVGTSGFSYTVTLPIGSHTIELTVKDIVDSLGEQRTTVQTWIINVEDVFVPTISGIEDGQKIESGSPIAVSISDAQSGVNWDSLQVNIGKHDVTSEVIIDENGFTIPSDLLSTGKYSIKIIISDNSGNITTAKYDIKVN